MCFSSTTTVRPTVSNSRLAVSRCASVACFPLQMPVMPAPTWLGVLGMARTTGVGVARRFSMKPVGTEAATEMTRSEEHTSELQSRLHLVCRLLLEKKNKTSFTLDIFLLSHVRNLRHIHIDGLLQLF